MTKYVFLTEFAPPEVGGIQASVGPMIEALGAEVTVIAPQPGPISERRIVRSLFSGSSRPRWWWLISWFKKAKLQGLQVAIFGHFSAAVYAGYIARRLYGLPYSILVHGNDLLSERKRWPKSFIRSALLSAEFIGVNSEFVEQVVREYGVAKSRIIRTHPFVRLPDSKQSTEASQNYRIITVARLVPRKNIENIIRAVAQLNDKFPLLRLDIVGDGVERSRLEALTTELSQGDRITFHGAVDDATKWRLLQSSAMFVLTPTVLEQGSDVEGLGLVFLEAAAGQLPIVASDTGGVRDAVIPDKTGLLVDPNNVSSIAAAIERLLKNPVQARQFGQAGKDLVVNEFTDTIRLTRFLTALPGTIIDPAPLVSVIIPVYQAANTIGATIDSVKKQTWTEVEIIVVDDGSTDNLTDSLRQYTADITLIQQHNAGAPTARNVGFDRSRGKYVLFLDADTVLETTAIEKMLRTLETHAQLQFVYSDFYFGWKKFHLGEYSSRKLQQQNYIHTSSLLRREAFTRFDRNLKKFQDWDLWLAMDEQGSRGLWIPEVLFRVAPRKKELALSTWLPSFVYRLPFIGRGIGNQTIAKYRQAEQIIRSKHAR